ncbi:MAG: hypothetical protein HW391_430 [Chloroflexi bacterium]|nr:hypothetical protein [Chloroflexota bacterium]
MPYRVGVPRRVSWSRRCPLALGVALAIALGSPFSALGRASTGAVPGGAAAPASTTVGSFTLDLSGPGDFVAQANFVQCVGASMQMMLNMIRPEDDGSAATQLDLQALARSLSGNRPDGRERKGASVRGWTAGLTAMGGGRYRTVGAKDIEAALKMAARAMRETNRPVGLLVWRGRHAWVMAGFTATADPGLTDDFEVNQVIVLDPLYPYGSKTWGPSPEPRASITVEELGRQFVPRGFRGSLPGGDPEPTASPSGTSPAAGWSHGLGGKYVIVMPFTASEPARHGQAIR